MQEKVFSVTTSTELTLTPGTVIKGRWKQGTYVIRRLLGQGANGVVYLVQKQPGGGQYALKLGFDTIDLQSEINVLRTLQQHASSKDAKFPYLIEVDDAQLPKLTVPFYVMRYVKGEPLSLFISKKGAEWIDLVGLHVLKQLRHLHVSGFVFGDLKPDNIMVASYGEAELIDYGGVSQIGRSVKQFTEWYDRGYWNAGSRIADEAYDWFAFSVVCIHLLAGEELKKAAKVLPQTRSVEDLFAIMKNHSLLRPYASWLRRGLTGRFENSLEALQYWDTHISRRKVTRRHFRASRWLTRAFILSLAMLSCALYLRFR